MRVTIIKTGSLFVAPGRVRSFVAGRTEDVSDDVAAQLIADRSAVPAEEPPRPPPQAAQVPEATPAPTTRARAVPSAAGPGVPNK